MYTAGACSSPRVDACISKLAELNPYVTVQKSSETLTSENTEFLRQYQVSHGPDCVLNLSAIYSFLLLLWVCKALLGSGIVDDTLPCCIHLLVCHSD